MLAYPTMFADNVMIKLEALTMEKANKKMRRDEEQHICLDGCHERALSAE